MSKSVPATIIVPASTSNLGPGFDTLGLALNRYLRIEVEPSKSFSLEITGEGAGDIPTGDSNLTVRALKRILGGLPKLKMMIHNEIPSCGGFGASGAAIIAGLVIGNEIYQTGYTTEEVYNIGVEMEGHPDNVSAALFGGLVVNACDADGRYSHIKISVDGELKFVAILPDTKVETSAARKLLPDSVTLQEAVSNVQHSSLLVAAFSSKEYGLLRHAVRDELHEKYRKKLIPHYQEFEMAALDSGALAFTVSGAGSGCIAFALGDSAGIQTAFGSLIDKMGLNWRTEIFEPVNKGVEILSSGI